MKNFVFGKGLVIVCLEIVVGCWFHVVKQRKCHRHTLIMVGVCICVYRTHADRICSQPESTYFVLAQIGKSSIMAFISSVLLSFNVVSVVSLSRTSCRLCSMGTLVNRLVTSQLIIMSCVSSRISLIFWMKSS